MDHDRGRGDTRVAQLCSRKPPGEINVVASRGEDRIESAGRRAAALSIAMLQPHSLLELVVARPNLARLSGAAAMAAAIAEAGGGGKFWPPAAAAPRRVRVSTRW